MDRNNSKIVTKWRTLKLHSANTNAKSEMVLNDLRLLELVYKYPLVFCKSMLPQNDKNYEEWGWESITKEFNSSYKGLSKPFTVEELRSRWAVLQPMCRTFKSTNCGSLPSSLLRIIEKIRQCMFIRPKASVTSFTSTSLFILNQLPLVEQLSQDQQRQLEVEVLDAIFREERISRSVSDKLSEEDEQIVQNECKEFLKSICVKYIPKNVGSPNCSVGSKTRYCLPASGNNKGGGDFVINNEPESIRHPIQPLIVKVKPPDQLLQNEQQQPLPQDEQQQLAQNAPQELQLPQDEHQHPLPKVKKHEQPSQQPEDHEKPLPEAEQREQQSPKDQRFEQPLSQVEQEEKPLPEEQQELQKLTEAQSEASSYHPINSQVRYVPLKCAKYYVKNVKVRIKRLKLKEILSSRTKRKNRRRRY